jgi:hypothetical protein
LLQRAAGLAILRRVPFDNFKAYSDFGWKLCAIRPNSKSPDYHGWNVKPIPADAVEGLDGAGLLHALSGTCCVDIDDLAKARAWFMQRDVSLDALLGAQDAVMIDSGRPGRAKLLYKLSKPLRTIKRNDNGFELRCATANGASVQDVLPPTIHPDTKKRYAWKYNEPLLVHWSELPNIPASLARIWKELASDEPATPDESAEPRVPDAELLEIYRFRLKSADPDMPYDDWLKLGMRAHDGDPSEQGPYFAAWLEWSKRGKKFNGREDLLSHWRSFDNAPGKRVATIQGVLAETPAAPSEFPIVTDDAPGAVTTEITVRKQVAQMRADALKALQARLVYVEKSALYFDCERHELIPSHTAVQDLFTWMMPLKKGGKRLNPVEELRNSGDTRRVSAVGFHPGESVIFTSGADRYANAFRNRLPEPIEPTADELRRIEWIFARITDDTFRAWLTRFFGFVAQRPGEKIRSAPLIWSETQGNGKSTLLKVIPSLLVGTEYSREVSCALLGSGFNDYVQRAWHINLAEFRAGTRGERSSITETLKQWISEDMIAVHPKGQPAYTMPNKFFLTATSNFTDAAQIDNDDRRWAIHEMKEADAPKMTPSEVKYIHHEFLKTERAAAVLRHYFLHVDISGFDPDGRAPDTASKTEMIEASQGADIEWIRESFEERSGIFARDIVVLQELAQLVHKHTPARLNLHRLGRILAKPPFDGVQLRYRIDEARFRAVIVRNHAKWSSASGKEIKAHIDGLDVDLTA